MDRIIEVKVYGNHLSKDSKIAGTRGEGNAAQLRITFDESWDGFAKRVVFWDALGENAVKILLGNDYLEDINNQKVYIVPIPQEAMGRAGKMTFCIDGYAENIKQRSATGKLEVKDAPEILAPVNPTPDELALMQLQLESISDGITAALNAKEAIQNMSASSETLSTGEDASVEKIVDEDGSVNLHFGLPSGAKGDTGSSGVFIGDEEPPDQSINVWIVTGPEESELVLRIKDENGNWVNVPAIKGDSAYEVAVRNGFEGTEEEWLETLSPYVEVTEIEGGHRVTITDESGEAPIVYSFDVFDGKDGKTKMSELEQDLTTLQVGTISVDGNNAEEQIVNFKKKIKLIPDYYSDVIENEACFTHNGRLLIVNGQVASIKPSILVLDATEGKYIDFSECRLNNLAEPTEASDAATRKFVEDGLAEKQDKIGDKLQIGGSEGGSLQVGVASLSSMGLSSPATFHIIGCPIKISSLGDISILAEDQNENLLCVNLNGSRITNLGKPNEETDATTKVYVDTAKSSAISSAKSYTDEALKGYVLYAQYGSAMNGITYRVTELENDMGDVETALDSIIAIQNSLIGGETV